jgi:hypothetical protein
MRHSLEHFRRLRESGEKIVMLTSGGRPSRADARVELRSLKALLAATGLRIAVRPIEKRAA